MSNKLIADLMSFRSRMVADARTQVMFEGDFDTIDQAIAELKRATLTTRQVNEEVASGEVYNMDVIKKSYGFVVDINGNLCGLVAGDMGYEDTGIKVDMAGWTPTPSPSNVLVEALRKIQDDWKEKYSWQFTPEQHDLNIKANQALATYSASTDSVSKD